MIRIFLLLLGTANARRAWGALALLGLFAVSLGVGMFVDGLHGIVLFPLRLLGAGLVGLGVATSVGIVTSRGTLRRLYVARTAGLLAIGAFVLLRHVVDDVVLAMLFGAAYLIDGVFRIAAASVVRFRRWGWALALGVAEVLFAAFIFEPYPTRYAGTVPVCFGTALVLLGVTSLQLAARLRAARPGASLPLLFSRCCPEDIALATATAPTTTYGAVTVHVWTPAGALDSEERRPVIDRYLAAVDDRGVISTGHAALDGGIGGYLSHYPAVEIDRSPDAFAATLRATSDNDVAARFLPSYEVEAAGWCPATASVAIAGADLGRLQRFRERYVARDVYNLTRRNCSTSTILALELSLEGLLARRAVGFVGLVKTFLSPELLVAAVLRRRAEAAAWTPGLALDYTRALYGLSLATEKSFGEAAADARRVKAVADLRDAEERATLLPAEDGPSAAAVDEVAIPAGRRALSVAAVVLSASTFGTTYGLAAPLVAGELEGAGHTPLVVGINAAMHAVGVLAMAPLLPCLTVRYGPRRLIASALAATAVILALFRVFPGPWSWFPLRFALGAAAEILLVVAEAWANQIAAARSRGKVMALYTAALSLGFAVGPGLLSVIGRSRGAFLGGAVAAALAAVPILHPAIVTPAKVEEEPHAIRHYLRLAPLAMATALLQAAVETAGLSFLPAYATANGLPEATGLRLVATLLVGAIVMQVPAGALADRFRARPLLAVLATVAAAGALLWPFVLERPWLAYGTMFLWGGVFVALYTVMLTALGRRFRGAELVGVYAVMSVSFGVGALLGPALAGLAVAGSPRFGLPVGVAVACAIYAAAAGRGAFSGGRRTP